MKIFEYDLKNKKRGKLLGYASIPQSCSGVYGIVGKVRIQKMAFDNWNERPVKAENYNVEAITFCHSVYELTNGFKEFEWAIVVNEKIMEKLQQRNLERFGRKGLYREHWEQLEKEQNNKNF